MMRERETREGDERERTRTSGARKERERNEKTLKKPGNRDDKSKKIILIHLSKLFYRRNGFFEKPKLGLLFLETYFFKLSFFENLLLCCGFLLPLSRPSKMSQACGAAGDVRDATADDQKVIDAVKGEVESKFGKTFDVYQAVSVRTQVAFSRLFFFFFLFSNSQDSPPPLPPLFRLLLE